MDEEPQFRGCYNITFICTPTNQETVCKALPCDENMNTGLNSKQTTCLCRDTGGKGTLPAQHTTFNTLDNWGHNTPTQSKRIKDRKEKIKGSWPGTCLQNTRLQQYQTISRPMSFFALTGVSYDCLFVVFLLLLCCCCLFVCLIVCLIVCICKKFHVF